MTVTIVAYKRPELLRQCLESIAKADLSPVRNIIFTVDDAGPEIVRQMTEEVMSFVDFFRKRGVAMGGRQLLGRFGVANTTRAAYQRALASGFGHIANEVCALEEDVTVSPDAFVYAEWALKQGYKFVNLCSHQEPLGTDPTKVHEDNQLRGGYGWCFNRSFWEYLEPRWNGKNRPPYGWDWYVSFLCYREKWKVLTPEVARVFHTGRELGTYMTPEIFDSTRQIICDVIPERYEIIQHDLDWRQPEWVAQEMRP